MNSKGWSVRGSHGKLLTDRSLRTQTENLANLSTRKGASMDLGTFQKIGLKDLDTFRASREMDKDKKRVKIAVKVVDIFGNDTMTIVDVTVKK